MNISHDNSPDILRQNEKVIIVGAGVMGLTSAIRLREAGYDAEIWAAEIPGAVSKVASFWEPFASVPDPKGRDSVWGKETFDVLMREARQGIQGLDLIQGLTVFPVEERDAPSWSRYVPSYTNMNRNEVLEYGQWQGLNIPDYARSGYCATYPTFDMPLYLEYLKARFMLAGGRFERRMIEDMSEPLGQADVVINCSGLAARELVGDHSVQALRGQLVKISRPVTANTMYIDDEGPDGMVNIMLHRDHIMLGGTVDRSNDLAVWAEVAAGIMARCIKAMPALAQATKISDHVGLRPGRSKGIRVEIENTGIRNYDEGDGSREKFVVHNYGHGGSGVTFSWGCANEVLRLVEEGVKSKG